MKLTSEINICGKKRWVDPGNPMVQLLIFHGISCHNPPTTWPANGTMAAPLRPLGMSVKAKFMEGEHRPERRWG
jgi:hypothetical protein